MAVECHFFIDGDAQQFNLFGRHDVTPPMTKRDVSYFSLPVIVIAVVLWGANLSLLA